MFRDLAPLLLLACVSLMIVIAVTCWRRWSRMYAGYRRLEVYADDLLQHVQGTILNVQGIASELPAGDPIRERIDHVLERADRRLANIREQMQPLCTQQQDRIQ